MAALPAASASGACTAREPEHAQAATHAYCGCRAHGAAIANGLGSALVDGFSDGLAYGLRSRCLSVVDNCTREGLVIEVDTSLPGLRVQKVLERLKKMRGLSHPSLWTTDRSSLVR